MTFDFNVNTIISSVTLAAVAFLGKRFIQGIDDIRDQLTILNGRIGRMEEWRQSHEKVDDDAHARIVRLEDAWSRKNS